MTDHAVLSQAGASSTKAGSPAGAASANDNDKGKNDPSVDLYAILFLLLMDSMEIRQGTVLSESKVLQANSHAQNELNKANGEIKFSIVPEGAKTATINRVQNENQEYAAMRENIQNELITTRQNAQVEMTQTSTNVNILEQDAAENSAWLKTLNTIFQGLDQMTKG